MSQTDLEWVLETMLDEMDTIIDERDTARGIHYRTAEARKAGRDAMRKSLLKSLKDDDGANVAKLRAMGADRVRAAVRRKYNSGVN
jgi:hypothetical protein